MKYSAFILSLFIISSCTNGLVLDRIKFAEKLIKQPTEISKFMDTTIYNCGNPHKIILNPNQYRKLIDNEYKIWKEEVGYIAHGETINRKWHVTSIDTLHYIVYKNTSEKHPEDFITLKYKFNNNSWCLDTLLNFDVLGFRIDHYEH